MSFYKSVYFQSAVSGLSDVVAKTLSTLAAGLAVLASVRAVATRVATRCLVRGSDSPWQDLWNSVSASPDRPSLWAKSNFFIYRQALDVVGDDFFRVYVVGSVLVTNGVFFGVGALFVFMDLTGKPAALRSVTPEWIPTK